MADGTIQSLCDMGAYIMQGKGERRKMVPEEGRKKVLFGAKKRGALGCVCRSDEERVFQERERESVRERESMKEKERDFHQGPSGIGGWQTLSLAACTPKRLSSS